MPEPLFSVLIANYNNGRYLGDAIGSVLSQTYANWEIIIVDDGSTDSSNDIYNTLDDNRIHIWKSLENRGCGFAKKKCAELANGDICGFLDADDVLLPNALQAHIEAHQKHPEVSCVFSRFYYCNQDLTIITNELRKLEIGEGKDYFTNRSYLPEHFASFKKKCYMKTEGISELLPAAVDQDLYFKLEEIAPVFILDKFTYKYRTTPDQISQGDNWINALYWNLIVRQKTCERRDLPSESYPLQDLKDTIAQLIQNQKDAQSELNRTRSSRAFRLGRFILHPFRRQ